MQRNPRHEIHVSDAKHTAKTTLQPDTQPALTAAATVFPVIDLNVRLCGEEVIIC